jgi:hypothetical protein
LKYPKQPIDLSRIKASSVLLAVVLPFGIAGTPAVLSAAEAPITGEGEGGSPFGLLFSEDFNDGDPSGWRLVAEDGAEGKIALEPVNSEDELGGYSLCLTVSKCSKRAGLAHDVSKGLTVIADAWYDLEFRARTKGRENNRGYGLTVSLESQDGSKVFARTTLPEVAGEWASYTLALDIRKSDSNAVLVITMSEPGTIWLDDVSLSRRMTSEDSAAIQQPAN